MLHRHTKPVTNRGRRHARLNPIGPADLALFRAALAGEHAIVGFRNRDLARRLHRQPAASDEEARRRLVAVVHGVLRGQSPLY
ncbi:MAG: hypothetical protein M3Q48_14890 [Actinomycetota bacterium]|nr:hypothetical protein [Actinomycetota bacterium]